MSAQGARMTMTPEDATRFAADLDRLVPLF